MRKNLVIFMCFFIAFTVVGEVYSYCIDEFYNSKYYYTLDCLESQKRTESDYIKTLYKEIDKLDLHIFAVSYKKNNPKSDEYYVFAEGATKERLKDSLNIEIELAEIDSIFTGNHKIVFKDLKDIPKTKEIETYYSFDSKEKLKELRSETIEEFGMSKPNDAEKSLAKDDIVLAVSIIMALIIFLVLFYDMNKQRKKIYVKYVSGSSLSKELGCLSLQNAGTVVLTFLVAFFIVNQMTPVMYVLKQMIWILIGIFIVSILLPFSIYFANIQKTLRKSSASKLMVAMAAIVLVFTSIATTCILGYTFQGIDDGIKTVGQKSIWQGYKDADVIYISNRDETKDANREKTENILLKFYNDNLDKYKIELSYDLENVGSGEFGHHSSGYDLDDNGIQAIYMNKYAYEKCDVEALKSLNLNTGINIVSCAENDGTKKEEAIERIMLELETVNISKKDVNFLTVKEDYEVLVKDIQVDNLASNYKKNPIVIVDMTNEYYGRAKFHREDIYKYINGGSYDDNEGTVNSTNLFEALWHFEHKNDFENYIKSVGYEREINRKYNCYDVYKMKYEEKKRLLVSSLIFSALMTTMYVATIFGIIKLIFSMSRKKIVVKKLYGNSLFKRHKNLIILITVSLILAVLLSLALSIFMDVYSVTYSVIASIFVSALMYILFMICIAYHEKSSVNAILKGK